MTEYQAVLLARGISYYGKGEKAINPFIEMADVYYVQNRQNSETKDVQGVLVKRRKDWHGPDRMYLNLAHLILVEPMSADSLIVKMIREVKRKASEVQKNNLFQLVEP